MFITFRHTYCGIRAGFLQKYLEAGDAYLKKGNYEAAIQNYRTAKTFEEVKRDPKILSELDGKISEAQTRRIAQLEEDKRREERLKSEAMRAKKRPMQPEMP
ncbi:MAG: hypothetical protein IPH12_01235 [Saprospirales bacterium]|nr:hypothetical protein [Saprospirales bacterium]